ncbi:hypothetical protein [Weissella paramesenteroides]|uniref:hypothetical protein n=1 Tax=Weissella paramesenteroides TaxID=1249 RepID=UPI00376EB6AE
MDIPNAFIDHGSFVKILAIAGILGMTDEGLAKEIGADPSVIKMLRNYRSDILVAPWLANNMTHFLNKNSRLLIGLSDGLGN